MREWKKIKYELKKYNKFESLYEKLKETELKNMKKRLNNKSKEKGK